MNINDFLDKKFANYPQTDELIDLRESIETDMNDFVKEHVDDGMSVREATALAIENASDLDQLLQFIGEKENESKIYSLYAAITNRLRRLELVNSYSVDLQSITEIHLQFHLGNVLILPTTDEKITVREFMSREIKSLFSAPTKVGNVLQIEQGPRRIVGIFRNRIEISLPQHFTGFFSLASKYGNITATKLNSDILFDITSTSGNIRLTDLALKRVQLDARSGNIKLTQLKTPELHVNSRSGNVKLAHIRVLESPGQLVLTDKSGNVKLLDVHAKTLVLNEASGNMRMIDVRGDRFDITQTSGNVHAENLSGAGKISGKSGNINVQFEQLTGKFKAEEKNGHIKVAFADDTSYNFMVKTLTGRVSLPDRAKVTDYQNRQTTGQVGQLPTNSVLLSTLNGNIKLQ